MPFNGFPAGVRLTPVPDPFFNNLLVEIKDVVELKVTLRALWLLGRERGAIRTFEEEVLVNDLTLLKAVDALGSDDPPKSPQWHIRRGLDRAVVRKTLLRYTPDPDRPRKSRYLLNIPANLQVLRRWEAGQGQNSGTGRQFDKGEIGGDNLDPPAEYRPSIYDLYEDNFGLFGERIAGELQEAEMLYRAEWIIEAFDIANHENKRRWSYIRGILRRWAAEGKSGRRDVLGATPRGNEVRNYGESGHYTPPDRRSQDDRRRHR